MGRRSETWGARAAELEDSEEGVDQSGRSLRGRERH